MLRREGNWLVFLTNLIGQSLEKQASKGHFIKSSVEWVMTFRRRASVPQHLIRSYVKGTSLRNRFT